MARAIELARASVAKGGGPFGAVIVKDGKVIAEASNRVVLDSDPTAHAEVGAIRAAAASLGTHVLEGCEVYSSCEPCPMCLGALFWSRVDRIYFGATRVDAAQAGFDDEALYQELKCDLGDRSLPIAQIDRDDALLAFSDWRAQGDRTPY
ncbi:MAG: guanine deaminase [Planctomycetota bacterium]|jgi:tRNA(Arg) A34 adenosine deaminase TadA